MWRDGVCFGTCVEAYLCIFCLFLLLSTASCAGYTGDLNFAGSQWWGGCRGKYRPLDVHFTGVVQYRLPRLLNESPLQSRHALPTLRVGRRVRATQVTRATCSGRLATLPIWAPATVCFEIA